MQSLDFFILGIIFGLFGFYKFAQYYKRKKLQVKVRQAKRAEVSAAKLLEKSGYNVIDTQRRVQVKTKIDGATYTNTIIADLIVQKSGKTYLVEVKTGKQTEKITAPTIRRQLLEYFLVFKPDGLILMDMTQKELHRIEFQIDGLRSHWSSILGYGGMFFLGVLLTWVYTSFIGR